MAGTIRVPANGRPILRASKRLLALQRDDQLVEQVRRGNERAFEVMYDRHSPGILSFCRHMLGSLEEAEDVVQHAFAAAHQHLLHDEREIRLKPWLYAVARNRCLSILQSRRKPPEDTLRASTEGLGHEVQRRADLRELVADLQDLPEDQRAALVLAELRDLSHADVAKALGCTVANVKGLVFRARAGLIERREARGASCEEVQRELATARGSSLRRGKLRYHLRSCSECSDFLGEVRAQRKRMALILPVVPSLGLKKSVLAAVGVGGGASGSGGGLLAGALPAGGATVAKVAVVGALVAGAGVAGKTAVDSGGTPGRSAPAIVPEDVGNGARDETDSTRAGERRGSAPERAAPAPSERRSKASKEGLAPNRPGRERASDRVPLSVGPQEPSAVTDQPPARAPSPQLPSPQLPSPQLPSPQLPSSELPSSPPPSPQLPSPELPSSQLPSPDLAAPQLPPPQLPSPQLP